MKFLIKILSMVLLSSTFHLQTFGQDAEELSQLIPLNPDIKIHIAKKCLIYYRIHNDQTVSTERLNKTKGILDKLMDEEIGKQNKKYHLKRAD